MSPPCSHRYRPLAQLRPIWPAPHVLPFRRTSIATAGSTAGETQWNTSARCLFAMYCFPTHCITAMTTSARHNIDEIEEIACFDLLTNMQISRRGRVKRQSNFGLCTSVGPQLYSEHLMRSYDGLAQALHAVTRSVVLLHSVWQHCCNDELTDLV